MGIPAKTIEENQNVYKNMLGLINGQVYYNLPNWYRLVKQFPGYNYNKKFMESMMGVKDKIDTGEVEKSSGFFQKNFVELPKLLKLVIGMGTKFIGLKKSVPKFNNNFDFHYNLWDEMNFEKMTPAELMAVYQSMQKNILRHWQTPIVNDFHVMIFYGTLKSMCTKWCDDDNGSLQNNLICGEGDIESTVPTKLLMNLAEKIQDNNELKSIFMQDNPVEIMKNIEQRADSLFITEAVADYLHKYGFRCIHELKLEEPSLHETPEFIYQIIANYVRMDRELLDTEKMKERENNIRLKAENDAQAKLGWFRKIIFDIVLKQARNGVKNRENMRFARTKIYGQIRLLLNAIGSHLSTENIIDAQQDIYYLTMDEVWDYIKGTAVTTQLDKLIELRKNEFQNYKNLEDPDNHFTTYGMVYHKNKFKNRDVVQQELAPGTLKGISCSPGKVSGIARVIKSPRDNIKLSGEILIADRTDPGWVPLYPSVSGILIERGSVLSHSAIVAREMGIPAIVGIPNLTKTIKDGDFIEVNATTGEILIKENDNE